MRIKRARFFRRIYLIFCLFLGVFSPVLCWCLIPDFNPTEKPLSHFGVVDRTFWVWNSTLFVLAIGLYLNARSSIRLYFKTKSVRKYLLLLLTIASTALLSTAVFSMQHPMVHRLSASIFFVSYNFLVFCFALLRSLQSVRKGPVSVLVGILMLLSSLLLLLFPSYGIFEIVYIMLVLSWNSALLYNRIRRGYGKKRLLQRTQTTNAPLR